MLGRFVTSGVVAGALLIASAGTAAAVVHPASLVTETHSTTAASMTVVTSTAMCPNGDRMLTGGAYWHRSGENGAPLYAWILSSAPTADAQGWYVTGRNDQDETLVLTTLVKCLPQSAVGTYTVKTREVTVDPHHAGNADLRCKSGQKVITGGGVWHRPGAKPRPIAMAHLSMSFPDTLEAGWTAVGRNDGDSPLVLRVTAFCLPTSVLGAEYVEKQRTLKVYQSGWDEAYVQCDPGALAVSGGTWWGGSDLTAGNPDYWSNPDMRALITSSAETGDSTSWYAGSLNVDLRFSSALLVIVVLCLPV